LISSKSYGRANATIHLTSSDFMVENLDDVDEPFVLPLYYSNIFLRFRSSFSRQAMARVLLLRIGQKRKATR